MDQLTIHCDLTGPRAVVCVTGALNAERCGILRETLDMALTVRPHRPVDVDLSGMTRLGVAARTCLTAAIAEGRRTGRPLHLRNVPGWATASLGTWRLARQRPVAADPQR